VIVQLLLGVTRCGSKVFLSVNDTVDRRPHVVRT